MQHVISTPNIQLLERKTYSSRQSLLNRFITWCGSQEKNRFLWLGVALMGGIGTIVPLTLFAVVVWASNSFLLWLIVCSVNVPVLAVNLAAQPAKITIPVLFSAWMIDVAIVLFCAFKFFMQ